MKNFKIRSISEHKKEKNKGFSIIRFIFLFVLVSAIFFVVFSVYVLAQVKNVIDSRHINVNTSIIETKEESDMTADDCGMLGCVKEMIFNPSCSVRESQGKTNIMLLGAGGMGHIQGGEDLTDTIIVASINHSDHSVAMVSIPRDLWVRPPGYKAMKINTLFRVSHQYYDEGFTVPKATIEDLLGIPIHYYAYIDFKGFEQMIDAIGGITVDVEKSFRDSQYPDGHFGYMTIAFEEGKQKMNGEEALQYSRSRHGNNYEGSDFARAKRQHKVIQAIKDKVLSFGTLFKIDDISEVIKDNYSSNIKACELYRFLLLAKDITKEKIHSLVLDDGPSGVLYTPTSQIREASYGGQYVLIPDGNNYNIIKRYVEKFMKNPDKFNRGVSVSILNGTGIAGLANQVGALLTSEGFNVKRRENTYGRRAYDETILFAREPGEIYQNLLFLEQLTGGKPVGKNPEPVNYGTDVVLILGKDYKIQEE
jgi:LCP family protein required for cell wall assembly